MRAKVIYEKFQLDSDPIHDMGIGLKKIIEKWLHQPLFYGGKTDSLGPNHYIENYSIRSKDLKIDADSVNISWPEMFELPEYIRFGIILTDFACHFYNKEYLKQLPEKIGGTLRIYTNVDPDFTRKDITDICDVHRITVESYGHPKYNDFHTILLKPE